MLLAMMGLSTLAQLQAGGGQQVNGRVSRQIRGE